MDSDASLITGEFLQDHPTGYYQIQGVLTGIDFQYSSLDADPYPIVSGYFTAAPSGALSVTSIQVTLSGGGGGAGWSHHVR